MKIIPESVIQQQAFIWFNNEYCTKSKNPRLLIHSVPNGVSMHLPEKEKTRVLSVLKSMGMVNGISDLIIHGVKGRCLMAECKTEMGLQSEAQIEIQRRIQDLNGKYFVFHSLDEFKLKILRHIDWLLGKID